MSSFPNQPVVEDIVSAFETTQNQPWSLFNDKLGGIPFKDCKKKDKFKSENPIELSDEDIPVFGLVPRLEKLMLVSCNKCSMIVKRDCIHYHYNRRHKDPENDFSLERFILPNIKTNKHKKQKISVRKLPEKKIIGDNNDPVVQEIKTEFDLLEFERLSEEKIKQENEIQYVDDCNANLIVENCNPSTSCGIFNWDLQPSTPNLSHFVDQKVNDGITECDKDLNKVSPVLPVPSFIEEPPSNTCIDSTDDVNNISNTINRVTNSIEMLTKSLSSNKNTKTKIHIDFSGIFDKDDEEDYDEIYIDSIIKHRLPFGFQSGKEQTKFTTYSNLMNDQSSITLKKITKVILGETHAADITNKYLENHVSTLNQSVASVGIEGQTRRRSTNNSNANYGNGKNKINGDSENVMPQLNPRLLGNKEQASFIPLYKNFQVTPGSYSYSVPNIHQSSASLSTKDEITQHYLNVKDDEKIKEYNENSKTVVCQLPAELQKNEGHIIFTPTNKNLFSMSDQKNESNDGSETQTTFSPNGHSSIIPFGTEENLTQSNEYTVISNENSDNDVTSNDESSSIELLSRYKKFKPLTQHLSDTVGYDYKHESTENEYFQLTTGYDNAAFIFPSPNFNYNLESESDKEESNEINDNCKNNYLKKTKLLPRNDYSDGNSSDTSYDQLSASSLDNKDESTIKVSEYSHIMTDNSCRNNSEICDQSSSTSSDIEDEETKCMTADSYSDYTSEDSSNDSDTSNEQSNTELQNITKNTKSTQTNLFLNHLNHKHFEDPITRIDESIAESLGIMNDDTKCTQTNLTFECDDCYKITEDLLDNYFPLNTNVKVGDVINSCDNSSAQIINNTIIPTTAQDDDYGNNNISKSSHSDLSSSQKFFPNTESQYDHSSSRLVQNCIIENLLENNEKHFTSEIYRNRHKHTEKMLLRNAIMKGSTPYMDKNHAICRDRLKKAIGEKIIYGKHCMKIPYEYDNIDAKIKKSLKRRLGGKVAAGKENHSTCVCISASFQKFKRIEFVTRKNTYSEESDNNDNVDE